MGRKRPSRGSTCRRTVSASISSPTRNTHAFVQDGGYTAKRWRELLDGGRSEVEGRPQRAGEVRRRLRPAEPSGGERDLVRGAGVLRLAGREAGSSRGLAHRGAVGKAARGPDGRRYPWGPEITPQHANYGETGIGATSAVGVFPLGASPYGALDMTGNAWEWCLTRWREDYTSPASEDPSGDAARVLRGRRLLRPCGARALRLPVLVSIRTSCTGSSVFGWLRLPSFMTLVSERSGTLGLWNSDPLETSNGTRRLNVGQTL